MVSHAVSHPSITTSVEKLFHVCNPNVLREADLKLSRAILSSIQMWQKSSHHTCTQSVRSDRASITSIVSWKTIAGTRTCKSNNYFLPFQSVQHLFVFHEAPYIALLNQVISKQLLFVGSKEFAPAHFNDLLKTNNAFSAKGW